MNARVQGLGPRFSLLLSLRNEGNVPVTAVQVGRWQELHCLHL